MTDEEGMQRAIALAADARLRTSPNPWVGALAVATDGTTTGEGTTEPPGGRHAEVQALAALSGHTEGATVFTTLEPCSHHGRTPPCADALIAAGVGRVVVGITDPDPDVAGQGISLLRDAGIDVVEGVCAAEITEQLAPYLKHRTTGRPWVICKLASTVDGHLAAPDGTSKWITGDAARKDAHRLRAESDAIVVGAGTVRADDPSLTTRHVDGPSPRRIVLGAIPDGANVLPADSMSGDLGDVLDGLGREGVLQVLIEGGASVAGAFHRAGLVDRYVVYLAPCLLGGDDGRSLFAGDGAATMADAWRGRFRSVISLGDDLRIELGHDTSERVAS